MKNLNVLKLSFFLLFIMFVSVDNGQVNQDNKVKNQGMGARSMQECMTEIATDKTLRTEMMTMMMENMKGDTASMGQVCREMMKDPEMHRIMMQMMNEENPGMGRMKKEDVPTNLLDSTRMPHEYKY
ncbi:MAG TPA: hypothetical protein VHO50_06475 [Bacteroidales bacterium]|nr:hypothetical protein [Bacteroidales bacterium]